MQPTTTTVSQEEQSAPVDQQNSPAVKESDNEELRIAISNWGRIRERLYRTAAEPLGARLPDCSNIVSAISSDSPPDIAVRYFGTIVWYATWLGLLHCRRYGREQKSDLDELYDKVVHEPEPQIRKWDRQTGFYTSPEGIKEWTDPWYFWSILLIRQIAEILVNNYQLGTVPVTAEDKPTWMVANDSEWQEDKRMEVAKSADERIRTIIQECPLLPQYYSLRNWTFKLRPRRKLYVVIGAATEEVDAAIQKL
ncbi:MAG: hypothetical protein M1813_008697 [Trichoglossum hirsutum]|nr:MAG: hypothetical protein M1813_008697 [Trichoglossum hirsutum]